MSTENTYVTLAAYADRESAESDWNDADGWIESVYIADAALIDKDDQGQFDIVDRMKHRGWGKGAIAGAAVAVLSPVTLVAGLAAGAVSGSIIARWNRSLDRGDVKDLGEAMDSGTTIIAVVTNKDSVDSVTANLKRAITTKTARGKLEYDRADLEKEFGSGPTPR